MTGYTETQKAPELFDFWRLPDSGTPLIMGIDPGNVESAYCLLQGTTIIDAAKCPNLSVMARMTTVNARPYAHCAIEMVQSFGMPVGKTVFNTVFWVGRFYQYWVASLTANHQTTKPWMVYRSDVKKFLGVTGGKDKDVRREVIKLFGGDETKIPDALKGVTGDMWSALAVALTRQSQLARQLSRSSRASSGQSS